MVTRPAITSQVLSAFLAGKTAGRPRLGAARLAVWGTTAARAQNK